MPIYHAPLLSIDPKETRRYAGLQRAKEFSEEKILDACRTALLLAQPRGIWQEYAYDCKTQTVLDSSPFVIKGRSIGKHLAGCVRTIFLSATVGDEIEKEGTRLFAKGEYSTAVLLDAAATTAVEQIADGMEKVIRTQAAKQGLSARWRFSPGYGDWSLEQQPEVARLANSAQIGVTLSASNMLVPRKSITAVLGLYFETEQQARTQEQKSCASCNKTDCPSRKK